MPRLSLFFLLVVACNLNKLGYIEATAQGDISAGEAVLQRFDYRYTQACGEPSTSDSIFLRAPYVQNVTSSSVQLLWTTRQAMSFSVYARARDGVHVSTVPATVDGTARLPQGQQWVATIAGLPPNAISCLDIRVGRRVIHGSIGVKTAPITGPPSATSPVKFIVLGDLGYRSIDQDAVFGQMRRVESDFILIAGDVAYERGTLSQLEKNFFGVYSALLRHVPVYPAIGNHDAKTANGAPLLQSFSLPHNGTEFGVERWYSFDWGPLHVAVLDTESNERAQRRWLDRDLASSHQPWKIVLSHKPPYSSGKHGGDRKTRRHYVPILERRQVQLMFSGHDHNYERTRPINGVTYVVTGAGGRGTRAMSKSRFTAFGHRVAHFTYVEATSHTLVVRAIDGAGNMFDSVRLAAPGS